MIWLGLFFSVLTVGVPMRTLTVGRRVITYRVTGAERDQALRGGLELLVASALWSAIALSMWVGWALPRGAILEPKLVEAGFHVLPIAFGWLPASTFVLLSWPRNGGYGGEVPGWVRWMDALWMG